MTNRALRRIAAKITIEPNTGCWLWTGYVAPTGYGRIKVRGKMRQAHRASWEAHFGPIPPEFDVCHRCDVRSCVNPAHLFVGTRGDNMDDCRSKSRLPSRRGDQNGRAILSVGDVDVIRAQLETEPASVIARRFGVSLSTIGNIRRGTHWGVRDE